MMPLSHYILLIGILTILYVLHRSFHTYTKYLRFINSFFLPQDLLTILIRFQL